MELIDTIATQAAHIAALEEQLENSFTRDEVWNLFGGSMDHPAPSKDYILDYIASLY